LAAKKPSAPSPKATVETRIETNGFPCLPETVRYRLVRDPATGKERVIDTMQLAPREPWNWAVCHAGSWVRHEHHYAWVVGHRRHHHPPVMWVKNGKTIAMVPIHPHDVANHVPVNHIHEVFAVNAHGGALVQPVHLDAAHPVEFLALPPKEFRDAYLPPLARAEEPHPIGHSLRPDTQARGSNTRATAIPFHFDSKTQTFTISKEVTAGGKTITTNVPIGDHAGNLQSHAGGGWSGGYHGSNSGCSGASHGSYSGSGSSTSGGGSHSSGGGISSSSTSSSSVSSTSASSTSSSGSSAGSSGGGSGGGSHK
jgi:hypothetical protein